MHDNLRESIKFFAKNNSNVHRGSCDDDFNNAYPSPGRSGPKCDKCALEFFLDFNYWPLGQSNVEFTMTMSIREDEVSLPNVHVQFTGWDD